MGGGFNFDCSIHWIDQCSCLLLKHVFDLSLSKGWDSFDWTNDGGDMLGCKLQKKFWFLVCVVVIQYFTWINILWVTETTWEWVNDNAGVMKRQLVLHKSRPFLLKQQGWLVSYIAIMSNAYAFTHPIFSLTLKGYTEKGKGAEVRDKRCDP